MKIFKQNSAGFLEIYGSIVSYAGRYKAVKISDYDIYDSKEAAPVFETIVLHSTYSYITR